MLTSNLQHMKTIFTHALIAILGTTAVQAEDVYFDFGRSDTQTNGYINISESTTGPLTNIAGNYQISLKGDTIVTTKLPSEEAEWKEAFSGTLPTGVSGNVADGILAQTWDSQGCITIKLQGLTAGNYSISAFGGFMGQDNLSKLTASIISSTDQEISWSGATTTSSGSWSMTSSSNTTSFELDAENRTIKDKTENKGYILTASNIQVSDGGSITLTLAGQYAYGEYGMTPLNYLKVSVVPEPTATTFGILALCGIVTRRRRK